MAGLFAVWTRQTKIDTHPSINKNRLHRLASWFTWLNVGYRLI